MGNRLLINMESRILGDGYVRFGGEYMETWYFKKVPKHRVLSLWYGQDTDNVYCRP